MLCDIQIATSGVAAASGAVARPFTSPARNAADRRNPTKTLEETESLGTTQHGHHAQSTSQHPTRLKTHTEVCEITPDFARDLSVANRRRPH
jgi:hypothetical protein